jgi:hypothetical protein
MPNWYEKQVGPLPVGIWVGVVVVGVGVSYYVNKKSAAPKAGTAPSASDALTNATDGAFGSLPGGTSYGGVVALPGGVPSGQYGGGTTGPSTPAITDNVQWLRVATDTLIGRGYDPGLVDSALRAYLAGNTPTTQQQSVINQALTLVGSPPFPVTTLPPTNTPPTTTYGPIYPQGANLPVDRPCPTGYVLIVGATGWTCATPQQQALLYQYLGH